MGSGYDPLVDVGFFGIGVGDGGEERLGGLDGVGLEGSVIRRVRLEKGDEVLAEGSSRHGGQDRSEEVSKQGLQRGKESRVEAACRRCSGLKPRWRCDGDAGKPKRSWEEELGGGVAEGSESSGGTRQMHGQRDSMQVKIH